jgi:aspartyl/glutamyl-tRNA(Asn/Gln) amidotransferase C subunit
MLSDIPEQVDFIDKLPGYSPELYINSKMKTDAANSKDALVQILPVLENITDWNGEVIHAQLFELIAQLGVKNGRILFPLRVALSGKTFTPGGGIEICIMLGRGIGQENKKGDRNIMMIMLDGKEIERVANLAKLDVSGEGESFAAEINCMLEMMQLKLDTGNPESKIDTELVNMYREDEVMPSLAREFVLLNAPETEAGCISIPKTAGGEVE